MIDEEVETVLREIRERVRSQSVAEQSPHRSTALDNGDGRTQPITARRTSEALARLNAHLTTTARAWDRLPPVFSNRRGASAKLELWIKAHLKRLSRWFTWEQVNFNAAVHHSLGEAAQILAEQEAAIATLQTLSAEVQTQREDIDALRSQLQAEAATKQIALQNQQREINALAAEARGELEALRIRIDDFEAQVREALKAHTAEGAAELLRIALELRERADRLENEQRVCFKQLSLETNEAAVVNDRVQRQTTALLEELDRRTKILETPKRQS